MVPRVKLPAQPVFDGHNDALLAAEASALAAGRPDGHLDVPRPRAGGLAGGVFAAFASPDTGPGLTRAGRSLVRRCAELGIVVDLSHLNEAGFWDVAEQSAAPLVASHSGAWSLCRCTRNLTDAQLRAIGASGGLVGVV